MKVVFELLNKNDGVKDVGEEKVKRREDVIQVRCVQASDCDSSALFPPLLLLRYFPVHINFTIYSDAEFKEVYDRGHLGLAWWHMSVFLDPRSLRQKNPHKLQGGLRID